MNVPLLDLKAQYAAIRDEMQPALARVFESQHFILGPEVRALETEIAEYSGTRFALGVSSGTDALLVALMALGIGPGDEVVTTAYSFFATGGTIARLGAKPVFVDIEPETFNIDPRAARAQLTARTRLILPVHLFGRCAELGELESEAAGRGIAVLEDAAQAIGARDDAGRVAGTFGTVAALSFFPSKNLGAFGDAGMVLTNDADLAERMRRLRAHGSEPKYYHELVGGNFRLDAVQAAVLRVKLRYLPSWTAARRANAERYRDLFSDARLEDEVVLPGDTPGHIYNQFVIRCRRDRDQLQRWLRDHEIGTEVYYPTPLHLQPCFKELNYQVGQLPESERAARDTLALPIYPELTEAAQAYVVQQIKAFYRR
jgi:dTDP-4-amino-4,6-dideoxygalactose transaminase